MVKEKANLEVRRNFYTMRAKRLWSRIPEWVEQVKSVNAFKNAHDRWIEKGGNPNDRDMYNADWRKPKPRQKRQKRHHGWKKPDRKWSKWSLDAKLATMYSIMRAGSSPLSTISPILQYTHTNTHTHEHTYTNTHTQTHTHEHKHTHTHTWTHTHTNRHTYENTHLRIDLAWHDAWCKLSHFGSFGSFGTNATVILFYNRTSMAWLSGGNLPTPATWKWLRVKT